MGETARLKLPYPELNETGDVPRDVRELAEKLDPLGTVPIGAMMMWMAAVAPEFWLLCNGASYALSAHPQLGALLGENPAGSGNFRVPDLLGRVPLGVNAEHPLSQNGGVETVALTNAQLPTHAHAVSDPSHGHGASYTGAADRSLAHVHYLNPRTQQYNTGAGGAVGFGGTGLQFLRTEHLTDGAGAPDHLHGPPTIYGAYTGIGIANAGGGEAHTNMPPFLAVNFIIRAG